VASATSPQESISLGRLEPQLARCRTVLLEGRAALEAAYRERADPRAQLKRLSALVDQVVRTVWRDCAMPGSLALLAVGGYGRAALFPYSDVDVLVLLPDEMNDDDREKASDLVSRLWDVGLELGHSARSIDECIAEGAQDITVQTNLIEARWIVAQSVFRRLASR